MTNLRVVPCAAILFAMLITGCGESYKLVIVPLRGGLSLDSSSVLAVGTISGEHGKELRKKLRLALQREPEIKLLEAGDRSVPLANSGYRSIADSLGASRKSLILMRGTYTIDIHKSHKEKEVNEKTRVPYIEKITVGRFALSIVDLTNHSISFYRVLQDSLREESSETTLLEDVVGALFPAGIDEDLHEQIADAAVGELYPHEDFYSDRFLEDDNIPELEQGIGYAKIGEWAKAVDVFKTASEKYAKSEKIHKVYVNLGLAYKWSFKFTEARECMQKAYDMTRKSEYLEELRRLDAFEGDYMARQQEQVPVED